MGKRRRNKPKPRQRPPQRPPRAKRILVDAASATAQTEWLATLKGKLLVAGLIIVTGAGAMAPGLGGELLNWDDDRFVERNVQIRELSADNLRAIFGGPHFEAYHPLHLLSYTLDYQLFGLWAPGYKLHNLGLYLLCLALLFRLLLQLGFSRLAALLGTLVFAAHPLHVEAVVWVSARKESLSLALMLGAALAYLGSASWRRPLRWLALALFGLALLAKTSTVVLPPLLVAIDVILRRRRLGAALLHSAPLWLLGLGVSVYVVGLWQQNAMLRPDPQGGAAAALVFKSYWHHASKLLVPINLSPVYPIDRGGSFDLQAALGLALLLGLGAALWRGRWTRLPAAWFLLACLPVCNLIPIYFFVQDRYAFVPSLALALAVASVVLAARDLPRKVLVGGIAAVVALLGALSATQAVHWRSSRALWQLATRVQPASFYGHLALGHTLRKSGELQAAGAAYRAAIKLQPRFDAARIALCLTAVQRASGAMKAAQVEAGLKRSWIDGPTLLRSGNAWLRAGWKPCAALAERRAFALRPPGPAERVAAASRWTAAGEGAAALQHLAAAGSAPTGSLAAPYHEVRAQALLLAGKRREARRALARSLTLAPRSREALLQAAARFEALGRGELARFYRAEASRPGPATSRPSR